MAALTGNQVIPLHVTGDADLTALYALRNVNTGDTADLSAFGVPALQLVRRAIYISTSQAVAQAAASGAVVTMPANLAQASGYLLVLGC